jgi:hypothetical protein
MFNFKKAVVVIASLALLSGPAWATCDGPDCGASFDIDAGFIGGGIQTSGEMGDGMITGGIAASGGIAGAQAKGAVGAGGFAGTGSDAWTYTAPDGKFSDAETSTWTYGEGQTRGHVDVVVDPTDRGLGAGEGTFFGLTGQGSASGSGLIVDGTTEGFTGAAAGQGSVGNIEGGVVAASGPDYTSYNWVPTGCWGFCGYWEVEDVDSFAGGVASASIDTFGETSTYANRYAEQRRNSHDTRDVWEECMESGYRSDTMVMSNGFEDYQRDGLGIGGAYVDGGWAAAGGAGSMTRQLATTDSGVGLARANSTGQYGCEGQLNENYNGHADGYTYSNMTTVERIDGVIGNAGASANVSSYKTSNQFD